MTDFDLPASVSTALLALLLFCGSLVTASCASYSELVEEAHRAAIQGNPSLAIALINEELDVDSAHERPKNFEDNHTLLMMERALLLQSAQRYRESALDFIVVDDRLQWVDLSNQTSAEILRFLYTEDAGPYQPPPHERLLLNTFNLINFLAQGDLGAARVEARRFHILQEYFLEAHGRAAIPQIVGLGNYLAGVAFEASREFDSAVRFYTRAYLHGVWPEDSPERLLDLIRLTHYQGPGLEHLQDSFQILQKTATSRPLLTRRAYAERYLHGDTLILVQTGMVPYRKAERVPIDRALSYSSRSPYARYHLSSAQRRQARLLHRQNTLSWINYATLSETGLPPRRQPTITLDARTFQLTAPISLRDQIVEGWDTVLTTAAAAAISRALVRSVVSSSTRTVSEHVAREEGASPLAAGLLSWLLSLAIEGTLTAADTPDTRSWTSLPADMHLLRLALPPGPRELSLQVGGLTDTRTIDVRPDGFQLVNFSRIR